MDLEEWAELAADNHEAAGRAAGVTPERHHHFGMRAAILAGVGDVRALPPLIEYAAAGGAKGARGRAGIREGLAAVAGVRNFIALVQAENAAEWESERHLD